MQIKYLGTAAYEGFPGMFCECEACQKATQLGGKNIRARSGMLINEQILMDFGPDMYLHKLRFGLDLSKVSDILITHSHSDHFVAWDIMIAAEGEYSHFSDAKKGKQINVYGDPTVTSMMHQALNEEFKNGQKTLSVIEAKPFEAYDLGEVQIVPLLADHTPGEQCLIYLIEQDGKRLLYGNDTGIFPEETWAYLAGKTLDLVSLDCTGGVYGGKHYHMGFEANAEIKQRLIALGCVTANTRFISTHFSHNCKMVHEELVTAAEPYGFEIAYDGWELEI